MSYVIGFDIGTTSTIGILIGLPDRILHIATRPVTLTAKHPGWAEEDPGQWWSNVGEIARELLAVGGIKASDVKAVGVTGMLPAVLLLDADGKLLRPSIQQSDARCAAEVEDLRRKVDETEFTRKTGNGVNQQLVIAKLLWIRKHEPEIFAKIATVFGSYDYINWRLTGERAVEQNWALEGGFVNLETHAIDDELVKLSDLPRKALPRKTVSHELLGHITEIAAGDTGLAQGTPVIAGAADHIASALAAGIARQGEVLLKFGGSVDVLIATDRVAPDPRMYLDYHLVPGLYVPNGCMATGGSGLNWFAASFAEGERGKAEAAGMSVHQWLDRLAAGIPAGAEGVQILPYFLGEKTPVHDADVRGAILGLSLAHGPAHLWRALLEAYAYGIAHHIEVLNDMGHATETYVASDGGSKSAVWMQIVADVLQKPVQRLAGHPGSCLGAAWTAAMGLGLAHDWSAISRFVSFADRLEPNPAHAAVYAKGYASFRRLYQPIAALEIRETS
ncbi:FGGY-family carbohydrate kinase [Taklimakanibacter lacteus]|uniref:FGGY-family carbohydrate kinase n=1 Tax=Taklimakanibacter lacteus TaxID=2268456 RepID=UPI000E67176F